MKAFETSERPDAVVTACDTDRTGASTAWIRRTCARGSVEASEDGTHAVTVTVTNCEPSKLHGALYAPPANVPAAAPDVAVGGAGNPGVSSW